MFKKRMDAFYRLALTTILAALFVSALLAPALAKKSAQDLRIAPAAVDRAALPRAVYLMRHAEKPASITDPHLSEAGVVRAKRLPGYIPGLTGKLDYIFATAASKNSNRPFETVTPLAGSLNVSVNQSYSNRSYAALGAAVRSGSYAGKTILISWHHGTMPKLASALGATEAPAAWPESTFNMIWKITYNPDGSAKLQQIREPF